MEFDIEKLSEEHEKLFPICSLASQLAKLDEENEEAGEALMHYIRELADCLIVCAGIYRFDKEIAIRESENILMAADCFGIGFADLVLEEVNRKWNINKSRKWKWNGVTYKHTNKDGNE